MLTLSARRRIANLLKGKPHKSLLVCEDGFLDAEEGVPVSDTEAIKWAEEEGVKFSELFSQ